MSGTLYIVGTPIGNLSDLSPRALEILGTVDFIAAEDTRVSRKLLTHFNISKPMVSCHEHNIRERSEEICDRLESGESCAIVTDAGMPCISDPGEELVALCAERGIETAVVPGPSAAVSALAVSGLPTSRFSFEGFLSVTKKQRSAHLESIKNCTNTLIFYEAPHKLQNTLSDLLQTLGDRRISLCRELTKIHEEIIRGTISEMVAYYEKEQPRGEYVLIIEGAQPLPESPAETLKEAAGLVKALIENGTKASEACREIAAQTTFSKSELYKAIL